MTPDEGKLISTEGLEVELSFDHSKVFHTLTVGDMELAVAKADDRLQLEISSFDVSSEMFIPLVGLYLERDKAAKFLKTIQDIVDALEAKDEPSSDHLS